MRNCAPRGWLSSNTSGFADGIEARAMVQGCTGYGFADGIEARAMVQGCTGYGFADGIEARATGRNGSPAPFGRSSGQNMRPACGFSLIELLVVLVILSILAAAAVPYAEVTVRREKELEVRRALREVRTAIDRFHDDWKTGRIAKSAEGVSDHGYPRTLQVLVDGIEGAQAQAVRHRYLRRIPRNPFADATAPVNEHWAMRGYQDAPDSATWGGGDVYDIRSAVNKAALDGTAITSW
jgi:general secretion pathway protein G